MRVDVRERRDGDMRRWLAVVAAVLLSGALAAGFHWAGVPVCAFHRFTGLPCLTCGSTRAVCALLAWRPWEALRLQPLVVVLLSLAGAAGAAETFNLLVRHRVVRLRLTRGEWRWAAVVGAALALLNWAYLMRAGV